MRYVPAGRGEGVAGDGGAAGDAQGRHRCPLTAARAAAAARRVACPAAARSATATGADADPRKAVASDGVDGQIPSGQIPSANDTLAAAAATSRGVG